MTLQTLVNEFKESKDPTLITVMVEDTAALLAIVIAAVALSLSHITGNTAFDAYGSLAIGLVLMGFAFFLTRENKGLLIGEAISKRDYQKIMDAVSEMPEVNSIVSIRTMHFAPEDVLIAMDVSLVDRLNIDAIESVIDKIEAKIKEIVPYTSSSKIYIELERCDHK